MCITVENKKQDKTSCIVVKYCQDPSLISNLYGLYEKWIELKIEGFIPFVGL